MHKRGCWREAPAALEYAAGSFHAAREATVASGNRRSWRLPKIAGTMPVRHVQPTFDLWRLRGIRNSEATALAGSCGGFDAATQGLAVHSSYMNAIQHDTSSHAQNI